VSLARALESLWWRRDEPLVARFALAPLSVAALAYRAGAAIARTRARPVRAAAPVISVGNLCAGGAGKTPVALFLCERLLARGERPALLSRGYGGSGQGVTVVCDGAGPLASAQEAGDEPVLVALRCPRLLVLAGTRRALLAQEAVRRGATVLVLDDGLQHHALARDLDLVVLDAQNPLGNGHLLPRGPLRESPAAFARVGARGLLWLTNARSDAPDAQLDALVARARAAGLRGPVRSALAPRAEQVAALRGAKVFLLAGIARPERFAQTVRALGAEVVGHAFFPDHHAFSASELQAVDARAAALGAARVVTTEKDLVRIGRSWVALTRGAGAPLTSANVLASSSVRDLGLAALPVELQLLGGAVELDAALDRVLCAPRGARP
jgi:tetraacyldisaccharide 4'-kinase